MDGGSRLEIRHSGHYELVCKDCKDKKPTLLSIVGAMTSRWQGVVPNLPKVNNG